MIVLAMDTSGPSLSVALLRDDVAVFECTQQNGLTHSDSLMPLVDAALAAAGLAPGDVDCFAVANGPGSFTGVRIGVTTAKALAHATGKSCVGVNALEALAAGAALFAGVVCPMQDARAGQVYGAAFCGGVRVLPDMAAKLEDYLARLPQDVPCCFIGDGAVAHRGAIVQALGARAMFPAREDMPLRASRVARLAAAQPGRIGDWRALMPYYLRAPQAERERLAREAQHG